MCLCDRDTCNGPSLPPREMIENDQDIIDIDEVVREMNSEPKEPQPQPVSGSGSRTMSAGLLVILLLISGGCDNLPQIQY